MEELLEQLKALPKSHLKYAILTLMIGKNLDYKELSEVYVDYLETESNKKQKTIVGLSWPLSYYWHEHKISKQKKKGEMDIFMKCKSAYSLLKSRMFHTAPIEKEFEDWLSEHPYTEDENGHHEYKDKE